VRAGDRELSEDELDAWCSARLARYKCPSAITVVDQLPRTVTGKVRRTDLRI
jgi:long-chain acyl-CoA synthetase